MTREQKLKVEEAIKCLNEAREHLDDAMYRMGDVSVADPDYIRSRSFYDAICKALDIM